MNRSEHPADRLIRNLIATRRIALGEEIDVIIARIASAPFDDHMTSVPMKLRGIRYRGYTLGSRERSLHAHLVQRVTEDKQWINGTTEAEYVQDLHHTAIAPDSHLAIYERRGGMMAGLLAPNRIDPARLGPDALAWIFIAYSADRGMIVSGYQASGRHTLTIPESAVWLT